MAPKDNNQEGAALEVVPAIILPCSVNVCVRDQAEAALVLNSHTIGAPKDPAPT